MTSNNIISGVCALAFAFCASTARADPVARVNGSEITEAELTLAEAEVSSEIAGLPVESRRRVLLEYLVEAHLLAEAAARSQLGQGKDFEQRLSYYRLRALRDTYYEVKVRASVTDGMAKAAYDEQIAKIPPEAEVHARHIVVKTEDEAKDIAKQLKAGSNFVELAKKKSIGLTAQAGGDMGYLTRGSTGVDAFENVVFTLAKGQISEPVKTDEGWHVIVVEDKRNRAAPGFDDVKEQIVATLVQNKLKGAMQDLRGTAKIDIVDPELKKTIEEETKAAAAEAGGSALRPQ